VRPMLTIMRVVWCASTFVRIQLNARRSSPSASGQSHLLYIGHPCQRVVRLAHEGSIAIAFRASSSALGNVSRAGSHAQVTLKSVGDSLIRRARAHSSGLSLVIYETTRYSYPRLLGRLCRRNATRAYRDRVLRIDRRAWAPRSSSRGGSRSRIWPGDLPAYLVLHHSRSFAPPQQFGPKMPVILRFNELRCNPTWLPERPTEPSPARRHESSPASLGALLRLARYCHRRDSRNHAKSRHLRPVRWSVPSSRHRPKIVLRRISREVFEWQHPNGLNCGSLGGSSHRSRISPRHTPKTATPAVINTAQEPPDEGPRLLAGSGLLQTSTAPRSTRPQSRLYRHRRTPVSCAPSGGLANPPFPNGGRRSSRFR